MKFKAKPKDPEIAQELFSDFMDEDGYIHGWYVDGVIVGDFVELNDEYAILEFWCPIDIETLEVIE
ncbi:hypothetical protein [Pseudolactococcus reticulitermitis]|uniref:Uncharacterized protein n=1 Tax=Pseudolactococcus reticulitermitis TaxID=2025039 RepID=A0A224X1M3_9LACT|nr:hypothetical protein [Lactococcus reticulitermitis]GAX46786.1 hypothetical protein RsY01_366 [Lactococcus reticulitermitis]